MTDATSTDLLFDSIFDLEMLLSTEGWTTEVRNSATRRCDSQILGGSPHSGELALAPYKATVNLNLTREHKDSRTSLMTVSIPFR
jgi:hypothetical protein